MDPDILIRDDAALRCETLVPFNWISMDESVLKSQQRALHSENAHALRSILTLEHCVTEPGDDDHGVLSEIQRLDQKINLVLELLGQLVISDSHVPDPRMLELSVVSAAWGVDDADISLPGFGVLKAWLNPGIPLAVQLPAVIESQAGNENSPRLRARFLQMPEPVQDGLERLVFIYHRRQIGQGIKKSV